MAAACTQTIQCHMNMNAIAECAISLVKVRNSENPKDILAVLHQAALLHVTLPALKETNIGREVNHGMLRHHVDEEVREAAAALVVRWTQLARSSQSIAAQAEVIERTGHQEIEPSTPISKCRQIDLVGSSGKEPQQHASKFGVINGKFSSGIEAVSPREYLEKFKVVSKVQPGGKPCAAQTPRSSNNKRTITETAPSTTSRTNGKVANKKTVAKLLQRLKTKSKAVCVRTPIRGMMFTPSAPQYRKKRQFCYSFNKTGECQLGKDCKYTHYHGKGK